MIAPATNEPAKESPVPTLWSCFAAAAVVRSEIWILLVFGPVFEVVYRVLVHFKQVGPGVEWFALVVCWSFAIAIFVFFALRIYFTMVRVDTRLNNVPLAIYVHMPWCVRKCPYCDFNSHRAPDDTPYSRYVDALIADLKHESKHVGKREIVSVFFGGGTPSLFPPEEIGRVIATIREEFQLSDDAEITLEANPGTVESSDPKGFREAGVNRLSIGAQSFSADALKTLGRLHSVEDIERTVAAARDAGFDNINLDIMYGLPNQSVEAAVEDLRAAIALDTVHLSWYQLTLEENTGFFAKPPAGLPDNDKAWEIQQAGQTVLSDAGYEQYEVSAYAKAGRQCRHNLNYWTFGDYVAVGAGAHGKLSGNEGIQRTAKPANPRAYMDAAEAGSDVTKTTVDDPNDRIFEFMLNALRLNAGFDESLFVQRTGIPTVAFAEKMAGCVENGWIERSQSGNWRPTARGRQFLNELTAAFLP
ncbi:MAG: radical SAM family heme chaperone HemW [Pseudomonadota bacterium]